MRIVLTLAIAGLMAVPALAAPVTVKITGVKAKGGTVRVALFAKEPLYYNPAAIGEAKVTTAGDVDVVVDVKPGDYVVSAFHDADNDGRLGFSNGRMSEGSAISNAEKLRGAPTFAVNKIPVTKGAVISIRMSYPEDRQGW